MSFNARRALPPSASGKRKEMHPTSLTPLAKPTAVHPPVSSSRPATTSFEQKKPTVSSNRLLAGYMAHEFLTKGTLFGAKFDPTREEPAPAGKDSTHTKPNGYAEVANILKTDGAHLPGVVNPIQLVKWIRDAKEVVGSSSQNK